MDRSNLVSYFDVENLALIDVGPSHDRGQHLTARPNGQGSLQVWDTNKSEIMLRDFQGDE